MQAPPVMRIDRCVCFQQSFADLKQVAAQHEARDIATLQEHVEFGLNCRLCHPYVRRMLRTGETVFHQIITDADEPVEAPSSKVE